MNNLYFFTELKLYKSQWRAVAVSQYQPAQLPCMFILKKHSATSSGYLAHQDKYYFKQVFLFSNL